MAAVHGLVERFDGADWVEATKIYISPKTVEKNLGRFVLLAGDPVTSTNPKEATLKSAADEFIKTEPMVGSPHRKDAKTWSDATKSPCKTFFGIPDAESGDYRARFWWD